jgi:hypothetical protein
MKLEVPRCAPVEWTREPKGGRVAQSARAAKRQLSLSLDQMLVTAVREQRDDLQFPVTIRSLSDLERSGDASVTRDGAGRRWR